MSPLVFCTFYSFFIFYFYSISLIYFSSFQSQDLAFCFICITAAKECKITNSKVDKSFISAGFSNWKDATTKFRKHETSDSHREAVERQITIPNQTRDIGETLNAAHSLEKDENRKHLLTILRSIRFLARQGLPLRGHDDQQSNFIQLLKLQGESDASILKWQSHGNRSV